MKLRALGLIIPVVLGSLYSDNGKVYANPENDSNSKVQVLNEYNTLSESDVLELKEFFLSNNVTYEKTLELIDKIDSGELLNSIDENFSDSKVLTLCETYEDGSSKEVYTYPDGSIGVSEIEAPESTRASISGGQSSSGTGYYIRKGATVSHNTGLVKASFKADYTNVNGGYDSLDRIYQPAITIIGSGANYSDALFGKEKMPSASYTPNKKKEDANGKAYATLTFKITSNKVTSTAYLQISVGKDIATASYK